MATWFFPLCYVEVVNLLDLINVDRWLLVHVNFTFPHVFMCSFQEDLTTVHVVTNDRLADDIILSLINVTDA